MPEQTASEVEALDAGVATDDGVATRRRELVDLTRELVRAASPSPPGDERAAAAVVRDYLEDIDGVELRVIARDPKRPNLVFTVGSGPTIGLFAHTDTVPIGDDEWTKEPFGGALDDDRIYGRGTTDNKGAVAAMAVAFKLLAQRGGQLPGRVLFCANADEERGGDFGIACVADELAGEIEAAVVAEPSGVERPYDRLWLSTRGVCAFRVTVRGRQMHSSLADSAEWVGVPTNAAENLFRLWPHFRSRFEQLDVHDNGAVLLNPVRLEGGVDFGLVPDEVTVWCECRVIPGMSPAETHSQFELILASAAAAADVDASLRFEDGAYAWIAPAEVGPAEPLVQAAVAAWRETLGVDPIFGTFPAGSDGAVLSELGIPTLPGVGPGALNRAHRADEFVTVNELTTAVRLYTSIVRRYLQARGGGDDAD